MDRGRGLVRAVGAQDLLLHAGVVPRRLLGAALRIRRTRAEGPTRDAALPRLVRGDRLRPVLWRSAARSRGAAERTGADHAGGDAVVASSGGRAARLDRTDGTRVRVRVAADLPDTARKTTARAAR